MSTSIDFTGAEAASGTAGRATARKGRWIDRWEPENDRFWESTGRRIATRNLLLSIFAEHVGSRTPRRGPTTASARRRTCRSRRPAPQRPAAPAWSGAEASAAVTRAAIADGRATAALEALVG
jgi:hypothetical protein